MKRGRLCDGCGKSLPLREGQGSWQRFHRECRRERERARERVRSAARRKAGLVPSKRKKTIDRERPGEGSLDEQVRSAYMATVPEHVRRGWRWS